MNSISNLLDLHDIDHTIMEEGKFKNQELQKYYNQFIETGVQSSLKALKIGATIEDLDINDLENHIKQTNNNSIIQVFEKLKCGSRNHLRAFVRGIEYNGETYQPKYISKETFSSIVNGEYERCGRK